MSEELDTLLHENEIIFSQANDWFDEWISLNWDADTRTTREEPPSIIDAFMAGWKACSNFEKPFLKIESIRCQNCGCPADSHIVDDEELRECTQCECKQYL